MEQDTFAYRPSCSAEGCGQPARYKVAAPWSSGTSRELKNYGLACDAHRDHQLERARKNCVGVHLAEGETLGPVGLYQLVPGKRDIELPRVNA